MVWKPDYLELPDAKDYLRIGDDDDDFELTSAIAASSRAIDDECGRQFGLVDVAEERIYEPWYNHRLGRWQVSIDDLMTTTGLVVAIADGGNTITEYELGPRNAAAEGRPWEWLQIKRASTVQPSLYERISMIGRWGWTTQPDQVDMAMKLQLSRFHARRESPFGVAGSPDQGSELRLLARLDPDVKVSLRGLVRQRRAR